MINCHGLISRTKSNFNLLKINIYLAKLNTLNDENLEMRIISYPRATPLQNIRIW